MNGLGWLGNWRSRGRVIEHDHASEWSCTVFPDSETTGIDRAQAKRRYLAAERERKQQLKVKRDKSMRSLEWELSRARLCMSTAYTKRKHITLPDSLPFQRPACSDAGGGRMSSAVVQAIDNAMPALELPVLIPLESPPPQAGDCQGQQRQENNRGPYKGVTSCYSQSKSQAHRCRALS